MKLIKISTTFLPGVALALLSSTTIASQPPFETIIAGANLGGGNIEPLLIDVGEKCGVDPRKAEMPWFNRVIFGNLNSAKVQEATQAQAEGNRERYEAAIASISC
ncbi:hypothetical protein DOK_11886 [gamma proteobacterium BDW918]|nr:hypothetical protein DOK_11886 [gamma proteobacterium BDW918]